MRSLLFWWKYEQGKFDLNFNDSMIFEVLGVYKILEILVDNYGVDVLCDLDTIFMSLTRFKYVHLWRSLRR